jgi:hypothetical protein
LDAADLHSLPSRGHGSPQAGTTRHAPPGQVPGPVRISRTTTRARRPPAGWPAHLREDLEPLMPCRHTEVASRERRADPLTYEGPTVGRDHPPLGDALGQLGARRLLTVARSHLCSRPEDPAIPHGTFSGCLDRRRERATIPCPFAEGLPKTSPSEVPRAATGRSP